MTRIRSAAPAVGAALLILALSAPAATWYVAPTGSDSNDGTSDWGQAKATLSNALALAAASDTILVSNGTYRVTTNLLVDKAVTIQGFLNGVAGGRAAAEETIIRRDAEGDVEPYHRVILISAAGAVLDGVTVSHGYTTNLNGAGIYMNVAGTIQNCIIAQNTASNGYGGGICQDKGVVSNCLVRDNRALYGGGMRVYSTLVDSVIHDNSVSYNSGWNGGGGGLYGGNGATILDCTIVSNRCTGNANGAGLMLSAGATSKIDVNRCLFEANTTLGDGGGLELREGTSANWKIRNCRFLRNSARRGGGIDMSNNTSYPGVVNCLIAENTASLNGGGISGYWVQALNCTITRNTAPSYGGISLIGGATAISATNSILYHNSPDTSAAPSASSSSANRRSRTAWTAAWPIRPGS